MGNSVFVVDDNIPVPTGVDDTKPINAELLRKLLQKSAQWEEKTLVGLFDNLLAEDADNQVTAFTNPAFCLNALKKKNGRPQIIIYDWDYPVGNSKKQLLEILKASPESVVAVYTRYDRQDEVSTALHSSDFSKFAKRLEVIRKDDDHCAPAQVIGIVRALFEKLTVNTVGRSSRKREPAKCVSFTVWYGTNRKPLNPDLLTTGYGSQRDDQINYGKAEVSIPDSHRFADLGSSWVKRFVKGDDDRLLLKALNPLAEVNFWADMADFTKKLPKDEKTALVFIHGYNVKFHDAVIRAAQIGFDLKIPGPTALFSWPSKGRLKGYLADYDSIEYSESYLADFLAKMVTASGAKKIHLIAHSMGNRGLLRCLKEVLQKLKARRPRFGEIFLAAPDVDPDLFGQLSPVYKTAGKRTTLYVCSKDKALAASSLMRGKRRVGFGPPILTFKHIDTVDASHLDLLFLGHDYYGAASELIYDIAEALDGTSADKRIRLVRCAEVKTQCFWRFRAGK